MCRSRTGGRLFALASLLLLITACPLLAQPGQYSRLGLSAAPDEYVAVKQVEADEDFTLYMIAIGPEYGPLPFEVHETTWAVFAACCGQEAEIVDATFPADMEHTGTPLAGVHCSLEGCAGGNVLLLAAITFHFILTRPATYLMSGGAIAPLVDCDGETHLLMDLGVDVTVGSGSTPSASSSWGAVKALFQ